MQNILKKPLVLSFLLLFSSTLKVSAIPCGNPSDPALLSRTTWSQVTAYKVFCNHGCKTLGTKIDIGCRVGFFGDYIFSENAGVRNIVTNRIINYTPTEVTIPKLRTCTTNVANSGIDFGIAFKDSSKKYFPLWDIEIYGKVGGLKSCIKLPMEAFRDLEAYKDVHEDIIEQPTYGLIEMQTNYGFSWDIGIKKVIWRCFTNALSAGFEYKQATSPMNYIILYQSSSPEIYFDYNVNLDSNNNSVANAINTKSTHSIRYKEWAMHLGASAEILPHFIPYVAIFTGNTAWKASNAKSLFSTLTKEYPSLLFDMRKIKNFNRIGGAFGASYLLGQNTLVNVEGRWGYQQAISINLKVQV